MFDKFHEECGVVGVYGHPEAATLAYLSLYALQHRGQESAGIVASNGEALISHRGMGHVADIFQYDILARLRGHLAIGHNRYSTSGSTVLKNCQPFVVSWAHGALAIGRVGDAVVIASETCALDRVDARLEREIDPGEIVIVSERGVDSVRPFPASESHHCVFEYVYFARPDSEVFGRNVYEARKEL